MTYSYNLRTNIKLSEKAMTSPDFKPNIWDHEKIVWYGLSWELREVFSNMRLLRKPSMRRQGAIVPVNVPEHPLITQGYQRVTIRQQHYWLRRDDNGALACWHRYGDEQVELFNEDFMGYFDLKVRLWDFEQ
jgi:hypothetical protein